MKKLLMISLLMLCFVGYASADVVNGGMESPVISRYTKLSAGLVPGWIVVSGNAGEAGIENYSDSEHWAAGVFGGANLNAMFHNGSRLGRTSPVVGQVLSDTLAVGELYRVSFDVAQRPEKPSGNYHVQLLANNGTSSTLLTEIIGGVDGAPALTSYAVGEAVFMTVDLVFDATTLPASAAYGDNLEIRLLNPGVESTLSPPQVVYDNVSVGIPVTAFLPDPYSGETDVVIDLSDRDVSGSLSWTAPSAYTGATYDVYFGTDPNAALPHYGLSPLATGISATTATLSANPLGHETEYFWGVDTYEPNLVGAQIPILHPGDMWSFTTKLADYAPDVQGLGNWHTWVDEDVVVNANVYDGGEGDIASVTWEIISGPGSALNTDMQMIDRYNEVAAGDVTNGDPNLLRDWIGTDSQGEDEANSDVLTLNLSGLPAGTYTWTSYHFDIMPTGYEGPFDVTINDSTGSVSYVAEQGRGTIDLGTETPNTFTATITSDGSDVELVFVGNDTDIFLMNGFELTGTGDPLFVDFTREATAPEPNFVMPGYQGYIAKHEVPETFITQTFTAFGTSISVTPSWDGCEGATITGNGELLTQTEQSALFSNTDAPKMSGEYLVRVTATDTAGQSDFADIYVRVFADACEAGKVLDAPNYYDRDANCVVDLEDFALFAAEWLNDISLEVPYTF